MSQTGRQLLQEVQCFITHSGCTRYRLSIIIAMHLRAIVKSQCRWKRNLKNIVHGDPPIIVDLNRFGEEQTFCGKTQFIIVHNKTNHNLFLSEHKQAARQELTQIKTRLAAFIELRWVLVHCQQVSADIQQCFLTLALCAFLCSPSKSFHLLIS